MRSASTKSAAKTDFVGGSTRSDGFSPTQYLCAGKQQPCAAAEAEEVRKTRGMNC